MARALLALVVALTMGPIAGAAALPPSGPPSGVPAGPADRLIVGHAPGAQHGLRALLGAALTSEHPAGGWLVVTGRAPAALRALPGVRFVEPDLIATADGAPPSDPRWSEQWGPQKIGAPVAWDRTLGSEQLVIGVVDSGADLTHPDLAPRLWRNPREVLNGKDDDGNGFVDDIHGADCRDDDGVPVDANGHGTHVAGIIGAAANETGIVGVDRAARIMPLRFLGADGRGRISDAIRCLDYAIAQGVKVTNHSWGTDGASRALDEAIARARAAGMIIVASAGNGGRDLDATSPVHYPSSAPFDNVVAVAASTDYDALAASSNRGAASVDIAAPGVGILSALPGGTWAKRSGTSTAAPHVTAAAALVMAAHPTMGYRAVIDRLLTGVDRPLEMQQALSSGGRLNVARAVEDDVVPPGVPTLHWLSPLRTATSITVAWLAPEDDGRATGTQPVARYELLVRRRGSATWWRAPAPWPGPPGAPESARIDGLSPGTGYDVKLLAIDNAGNLAASAPIMVSTA